MPEPGAQPNFYDQCNRQGIALPHIGRRSRSKGAQFSLRTLRIGKLYQYKDLFLTPYAVVGFPG